MNTVYLKEFLVFAESLNYTAAARALYISQPTLSRHIADLEQDLGVDLVSHDAGSAATLTYAGETLLAEAGRMMQAERDLRQSVSEAARKVMATLRIESYPYMRSVSVAIGNTLAAMQEQNPDLHLDVDFLQPKKKSTIYESVLDGYLDVAMLARTSWQAPEFPVPDGIAAYPLMPFSSRLCFFVSNANPLAKRDSVGICELDGCEVLMAVNYQFENIREDMRQIFDHFGAHVIEIPFRMNEMSEFSFNDIGNRVHFLTEDDLSSPASPYLMNPRGTVVRCSDAVVTTPYFICREEPDNPAVPMFLKAFQRFTEAE